MWRASGTEKTEIKINFIPVRELVFTDTNMAKMFS